MKCTNCENTCDPKRTDENGVCTPCQEFAKVAPIPSYLKAIRDELHAQDNRCTSHPIYMVQFLQGDGSWVNRMPFFTNKGAQDYIDRNHDYRDPAMRIYVMSGYDNPEWITVRRFLRGDSRDD